MKQTPSFRRSRDLDKSNKFGQMQELTNDNYSEIKLCSIFRIEYKAIEFSTNKKEPTITFPIRQYWNDNEAAPANCGFVNKANNYETVNVHSVHIWRQQAIRLSVLPFIQSIHEDTKP